MKKNILIIFSVIVFAVIVQKVLSNLAFFENLELMLYDFRSKLAAQKIISGGKIPHADKDIVIIGLDDYSRKKLLETPRTDLGPWPWHRDVWNEVLDFIESGDPKVVMFDMVFENLNENSWYDRRFAQGLRRYNNIVLGTYLDNPKISDDSYANKIHIEQNDYLPTSQPLSVITNNKKLDDSITYYTNAPVHNIYTEYNTMGILNKVLDADNSIRKNQPIYKLIKNGKTYYMPSLAFAGFLKYMGDEEDIIIDGNKILYKDRIIPVDDKGVLNLTWKRIEKNYSYIPISKILLNKGAKNDLKPEFFKDKLVIIGKTAAGKNIDLSSIIDPSYVSPEANAIALDNFINDTKINKKTHKKFISNISKPAQFLITVVACIIVGSIVLVSKSAFVGCINGVFLILLYVIFSFWLFVNPNSRIWLPIVVPIYYLALTSGVVFAFRFYREITRKTSLMNTFGKFVSPKVLSTVIKNPEKMILKNTKKRITILFCDVKDFSNLCEKYDPEKLISNLNDLFKEIVNIIFENNGTVDKFIGDCIMAYWGDLVDSEDDEYKAIKTALEIKKRINELKIENAKEDKIIFDVKIGINTGEAVLGLAGTDKIMNYTAMGDAVNIASRLESACSTYNKDILISKSTYEPAKDKIVVLDVGNISIKGKDEQINVYEPLSLIEDVNINETESQNG